MIKASAGGGGKGMRIAYNDEECREGFQSATNEAKASFADDRVFIEKYVEEPRHIEIQLIADGHGDCLYLWERECSIQRRHQKVIEEAPSPFLDARTRKAMGEEAVALAKAVKYKSAGTVEFIVDKNRKFYFLEMNTRLQVEHPVTELVTGLDLVELMIRVAAGEKLPLQQKDVKLEGWAVECRLYAEDPFRNFLPSTGRLVKYREPEPGPDVRVDSGVYEGGEISMFYDPMIAKLCSYGQTRLDAIERMRRALDEFYVRGVSHNVPFLAALMAHPRFREGRLTTNFIAEEFKGGFTAAHLPPRDPAMLAAVAAVAEAIRNAPASKAATQRVVMLNREPIALTLSGSESHHQIDVADRRLAIETNWAPGEPLLRAHMDGRLAVVQIDAVQCCGFAGDKGFNRPELNEHALRDLRAALPPPLVRRTLAELCCDMGGAVAGVERIGWFLRALWHRPQHGLAWHALLAFWWPDRLRSLARRLLGKPNWERPRRVSPSPGANAALAVVDPFSIGGAT